MPNIRVLQRSFNGGEIGPEMYGQIADAKYQSGLARCRNFITKPQGPAENRPGFAFVREVKDSAKKVRLIPFTYSTTQTMVIELGAGYFRFHTQGATLMNAGVPYEIASPYAEADLFDIHYVQSADVLTLVHPNYAPRELRRLGATNWQLTTINLSASILPPPLVSVSAYVPKSSLVKADTKIEMYYVVTCVTGDGISESAASNAAVVKNNIYATGARNTVFWDVVSGAQRYNVYKKQGGIFGYIGTTTETSMIDDNIGPDLSKTPPSYEPVFLTDGIKSVAISSGGSGYGSVAYGGGITDVDVVAGGSGYTAPALSVSDPTGSGAAFSVTEVSGVITEVIVTAQGSGYTNPTFAITGGGSGAKFSAAISALSKTPKLAVADSTGKGAIVVPVVAGGVITGVNVVYPGEGYSSPSISIIEATGGAGATFGAVTKTTPDYPGATSYFEQRRVFAGTSLKPKNIWMTRSGTEADMSYSLPIRDDDRISFQVAAREANTIRHIVPLTQLLLLTSAAEWRVTSVNSDAITPSTISVRPQSYVGASNVQPVTVNNTCLYGAARGGHVRELAYSWQANGFVTGDLSLRAPHLFDTYDITDMAYAKAPQPLVWFVSTSGKLLGLTYVPEQQVGAWHQHDTDGAFESCAVVAEGQEDVLYCVIRRTINGSIKRYVERMHSRQFTDQADAFFVDCGATYDGAAADVITGLNHLEGKTVSILADGAVHPQRVVTGGSITLDQEASKVQIGLPITADLQTLPIALQIDSGFGQGRYKNVNKAWLRVYRSSGIFVGPDADKLTEMKQRTIEPYGSPPVLKSEEMQLVLTPSWADSGQVYIRQADPLPLTVVSMTLEVAIGG
ncbi:MAG: hypothetical protein ACKO0Z_13160 [Betaproteobacteria bacterium]